MNKPLEAINALKDLTLVEFAEALLQVNAGAPVVYDFENMSTSELLDLASEIFEVVKSREVLKVNAVQLSSLPVGAVVRDPNTKYYDEPILWVVAGHDHYESDATVLLAKHILTFKAFDAAEPANENRYRRDWGNNHYPHSNIRQWMNSVQQDWFNKKYDSDQQPGERNVSSRPYADEAGFLANFNSALLKAIINTKILSYSDTAAGPLKVELYADKVFLLSRSEVGLGKEEEYSDGSVLPLFTDEKYRIATPTASCTEYDEVGEVGTTDWWWLRTPNASCSSVARLADTAGMINSSNAYGGYSGVRPALNLPSSITVTAVPDGSGIYDIILG